MRECFDNGDGEAFFREGLGELQADEAGADDAGALRLAHRVLYLQSVVDGSKTEDACGEGAIRGDALDRGDLGSGAGGEDETVEGMLGPCSLMDSGEGLGGQVDGFDGGLEVDGDVFFGEPVLGEFDEVIDAGNLTGDDVGQPAARVLGIR